MATIIVTDLSNISVDGTPAGSVVDVLVNYGKTPGFRADLLRALRDWHDGDRKAVGDAAGAQVEALKAEHAARVADLTAQVEALGGTEQAERLRRDARIRSAQEAKARAEKELADLNVETG
jgi:hypothetical protein